jgi:hypothetical protein
VIGGSICFGLRYLIYLTSGKKEDEKRRDALAFQLLAGFPPPQPDRDIALIEPDPDDWEGCVIY